MNATLLFRPSWENQDEGQIASGIWLNRFKTLRSACRDSLVIPRYSCLPYYKEFVYDLDYIGSKPVNSYEQHRWIADFQWYHDLKDYTFETYDDSTFHLAPEGQYVVKGRTNSRKHHWRKLMYAENKRQASEIAGELSGDELIGQQGILYRRYEPLKTYEIGANGLPFTHEFRYFFLKDELVANDYYWSNASDETIRVAREEYGGEMLRFAKSIARIVAEKTNFFVLDIAQKENGDLVLVEINDGGMSGLSTIDSGKFYGKLWQLTS